MGLFRMANRGMSNSQPNLIEARRERVAALTLRGFTAREIVAALGHGENALLNPKTGRPYSIGSIARDLMALKRRWLEASQENYAAAKARHLAEIGALKRAAWAAGDLAALARALDREARVWGFDAPGKHELTGAEGEPLYIVIGGLDPDKDI